MTTMPKLVRWIVAIPFFLAVGCTRSGDAADGSSGVGSRGPALEGTRWMLTTLGDTPAEITTDETGSAHILLTPDEDDVSGSTGVNFLGGKYTLKGDALRFGPLITTRRAGPPALMQQEIDFTRALDRTRRWRIGEAGLELLDADGRPVARFRAGASAGR